MSRRSKGIGGKAKWCRSGSKLARGENESDGANEKNSKMYECVWREKVRDKGRDNKRGENRWSIEARYTPSDSDVEM